MNWFNIVNFILALAPQELALVKAIVDAAHVGHQSGAPLQPVQTDPAITIPSVTMFPISTATQSPALIPITQTVPNTEKEVLQK